MACNSSSSPVPVVLNILHRCTGRPLQPHMNSNPTITKHRSMGHAMVHGIPHGPQHHVAVALTAEGPVPSDWSGTTAVALGLCV